MGGTRGSKSTKVTNVKAAAKVKGPAGQSKPKSGTCKVELDIQTTKTLLAALTIALGGGGSKKGKGKK